MATPEKQSAVRVPLAPILLALFIGVPLAEIAVFIQVGGIIGLGWTLVLIVLTALAGTWMLRAQGFAVLQRARTQLDQNIAPVFEVFEGVCLVIAGALLLTPGFITDAVGAALLLPPVRTWLYARVRRHVEMRVAGGQESPPPAAEQPRTIDVDFEEVEPERDAGGGSAGEDGMPPPRGTWERPQ